MSIQNLKKSWAVIQKRGEQSRSKAESMALWRSFLNKKAEIKKCKKNNEKMLAICQSICYNKSRFLRGNAKIVGVDGGEGPPVPIPNTEVKLTCADDTWLVTARKNR